ncbi:FAD/NAD(P)-binding domain superfamily [Fusarium oxysporum f. sp. vasinfectum]|nr:FAD/NAD(P)-binding domain superfamily [Fusarium oxysporum f. sp. vasinfectum]
MVQSHAPFSLKDSPIENQRPLKVVIIGAGFCGIYTTIRIIQRLRNVDLTVYDMNDEVSGVWWLNRYPGLACDIPSYSYQFSFAPNPYWSSLYAPGPEICAYMQDVAERYGAMRFIKVSHKVEDATWDEELNKWHVTVRNLKTNADFKDTADVVISARGGLNKIAWPKVEGLGNFEGKLMHSGAWDESYDCRNKKIGVIGNGSSGIQIVPSLQRLEGTQLWCFVRSPTWIAPGFGDSAMRKMGKDPKDTQFSKRQQQYMARHPEEFLRIRKLLEDEAARMHPISIRGSEESILAQKAIEDDMRRRSGKNEDIINTLLPKFAPGCRRLTPGANYLEALQEDNVHFTNERIQRITPRGLELASGQHIELDLLVCATGYDVEAPPEFDLIGREGLRLAERWKPYPEAYLGMALLRKMQKEDYATFEVDSQRVADFGQYIEEYFKRTVFTDDCSSWYKTGRSGSRIVWLWPGSSNHCLEALRAPRWEDFNWKSANPAGNRFGWLGNGWSMTLTEGDPSWFLDPDVVDEPCEPKPEESEFYRKRPFSH